MIQRVKASVWEKRKWESREYRHQLELNEERRYFWELTNLERLLLLQYERRENGIRKVNRTEKHEKLGC